MRKQVFSIVVVLLLCLSIGAVYAGDGGGKSQLKLDEAEMTQDLENIGSTEVIKLTFSNNVVNLAVKDNNMTCFTMSDEDGSFTEFEVLMGDDQENKEIKRIIEIKPTTAWETGTTYTIHISDKLSAKNEMLLGEETDLTFTTEGRKSSGNPLLFIVLGIALLAASGGFAIGLKRKQKS